MKSVIKDRSIIAQMFQARWLVLAILMIIIGATVFSIPKLSKDTSADAFIDPNLSALVYKERVEEVFGLTDPIVVAVINRRESSIFNAENLALIEP